MTHQRPSVYRISISPLAGQKKTNVPSARLDVEGGILGDAHGATFRQVSLLPYESFSKLQHPELDIQPGDFAENITTKNLDFEGIKIGTRLKIGENVRLEIIQIGKECHNSCIIRETVGDCIMPKEGVFARVRNSGTVRVGDPIEIESEDWQ